MDKDNLEHLAHLQDRINQTSIHLNGSATVVVYYSELKALKDTIELLQSLVILKEKS